MRNTTIFFVHAGTWILWREKKRRGGKETNRKWEEIMEKWHENWKRMEKRKKRSRERMSHGSQWNGRKCLLLSFLLFFKQKKQDKLRMNEAFFFLLFWTQTKRMDFCKGLTNRTKSCEKEFLFVCFCFWNN